MQLTKKQTNLIIFLVLLVIAIFVGAWFVAPSNDVLETVTNKAIEECDRHDIALTVGDKKTVGVLVKTLRFENVIARLNPGQLTFSSINATPSWKAYAYNVVDGTVSFRNVSLEFPFFGALNFGSGKAHLFIDKEDNIYITDFNFKGICGIKGHLNIIKTQNLLDYSFTFTPSKERQAFFLTLITFGVPFEKNGDGSFTLESKSKLQ